MTREDSEARRDRSAGGERRLFVARAPRDGGTELHPDDLDHALRVLRLERGERVVGVDGRGRSWRCVVGAVEKRSVRLEQAELLASEPPPGAEGAQGPAITVHVALPRPGPAEEMLDRLTQLGVSRIVPLVTERSGPHARELSTGRRERFERILREAVKQSGRLWLPALLEIQTLKELRQAGFPGPAAVLDPDGPLLLLGWALAEREARSLDLVIGPEGGLTGAEVAALVERGAVPCRIARHVLRIETAAEAALAVLAAVELER